jgi:hypothetical protein
MASDDDTIYVDVAARLDEKAADQATGKLRDKFKGVGKHIGDAVGSAASTWTGPHPSATPRSAAGWSPRRCVSVTRGSPSCAARACRFG